jgi:hypothetical protein
VHSEHDRADCLALRQVCAGQDAVQLARVVRARDVVVDLCAGCLVMNLMAGEAEAIVSLDGLVQGSLIGYPAVVVFARRKDVQVNHIAELPRELEEREWHGQMVVSSGGMFAETIVLLENTTR